MNWLRRYVSLTLIVVVAFVFFVLFFNDNSILQSFEYNRQIQSLKDEIRSNEDTLRYYQELNDRLDTDPETMERIVREQYHMQRPSEDVYVFE
ncbi:MAG: septum formation initiator family protein [Muribaculaceae bacterium]|nr:septum formation initiator family protein [Muribaculaceae bacterium]